jgi:acyl-CoA reductase-like NAD-dependent aldehyde dehydrogenase
MNDTAASGSFRPVAARVLAGGGWREPERTVQIRDPFRGEIVGTAPVASMADLDAALGAAVDARAKAAAMPGYERAALLRRVATLVEREIKGLAELLTRETGKAVKDSEAEIRRSIETFALAAEEAIRIEGRHVPLDGSAMGAGKMAFLMRFPVGVVAAITPFNAPFNLAAHKIAPAIAAGNAMVLKPPPQAPLVVHRLAELVVEAGLPAGMLNVVYGGTEIGAALVADARVEFITFTGSTRAGVAIKAASGLRRVALELGGNGATIVHDDADLAAAAAACGRNSMRLAGQSCISVQSVYVHERVCEAFLDLIEAEVRKLKLGDPLDPATDVGTLTTSRSAAGGKLGRKPPRRARVVAGGQRHGAAFEPTALTRVEPRMKVVCDEVFGPVAIIMRRWKSLAAINASPYGLQAGIFHQTRCRSAIRSLRVGVSS